MRVSTFLLGGIAGAAAVIYLNRKSKSMLFSAFSSTNDSVTNFMNTSKNPLASKMNMNTNSASNLNQVEKFVKEDPALKHKVNEILADNNENTQTIQ